MGFINDIYVISGDTPTTGDYLVRFIDFDGTILKQQWVNNGDSATAPTPPTHDLLTFQEWNNDYDNITHDLDVGATYYTTDGKTYLFMRFTNTTGLQPTIYLNKADTSLMTVTWGDGTSQTTSASGNVAITKTNPYAAIGDYTGAIECAGGWNLYTSLFNNNTLYNSCLTKCYLGNHVTRLMSNALGKQNNLEYVVFPNSCELYATSDSIFSYCLRLQAIIIPSNITILANYSFISCHLLKIVSLPEGLIEIGSRVFEACYALESIILPSTMELIGSQSFYKCYSLTKITNNSEILVWGASYTMDLCYALKNMSNFNNGTNSLTQCFGRCPNLEDISISTETTNISTSAFYECMSLKTITIPYKVSNIGIYGFQNCFSLLKYLLLPTTPPTLADINAFTGINLACKMYVPDASLVDYQGATNWITYANYFYPISELPEYDGTIFFQSNGGNAIKQITGTVGAVSTEPTAPTKAGFTFDGWYKDAGLTTAWNWATDVYPATNLTLYAKWI
jgi:uncharacterized repeat protein (TIGR02543 family)